MDDGYIAVLCRKKTSVKKGLRPLGKISLLNLVIWVGRRPQLRRDCDCEATDKLTHELE